MRNATDLIVLHCSATPATQDIQARDIDRWHRQKGWLKIGYHFVITRDGTVQKGRDLDVVGAHVAGHNHHSIGICLVGGTKADCKTPENNFADAQWAALGVLLSEMQQLFPLAQVIGHYQLDSSKACPSFDVVEYLKTPKQ